MQEMIRATIPGQDGGRAYSEFDPWLELAAAIVKNAAFEYMDILRALWKGQGDIRAKRRLLFKKIALEEFFHSDWYGMLTEIDPDALIFRCRIRAKEKEMAAIARQNSKRISALMNGGL